MRDVYHIVWVLQYWYLSILIFIYVRFVISLRLRKGNNEKENRQEIIP